MDRDWSEQQDKYRGMGLDEMLGGGFPAKSIVLVWSGSGAVKTVLSVIRFKAVSGSHN